MTQRYYTGTKLKTLLSGDRVLGRDLIRKARAYTGYLFDQLTEKQKYRTQQWNDPNGSKIQVFVWRDVLGKRAIARIFVPETSTATGVEIVCTLTSGLFSVLGFTTGNAVQLLGDEGAEEERTSEYSFLTSSDAGATWDIGDFESTRLFLPQFQNVDPTSQVPYPDSAPGKHSGNYSGTMREVVQLLAGQSYPIRYQYSWPTTHGIFVNQITQQRWVIEIAATGVTAWPLPVCTNLVGVGETVPNDITEIPISTSLPGSSARIILCDAAEVADAYSCAPMTTEHGWAFSYSGHEAQHVVFRSGYGPGAEYQKAFRYSIAIEANWKGDPRQATMTEEESEIAWSNNIQAYVRVPRWTNCGPASQRYLFNPLLPAPSGSNFTFPIYVYYDGDEAKILKYEILAAVVQAIPESVPYSGYGHGECSDFPKELDQIDQVYSVGGTLTKWGTNILGVPGATPGVYNHFSNNYPTFSSYFILDEVSPGPVVGVFTGGSVVYGKGYYVSKYSMYNGTFSENENWSLVLPFFEREGYYLQRRITRSVNALGYVRRSTSWLGGLSEDKPAVGSQWTPRYSMLSCIADIPCVYTAIPSPGSDCSAGSDPIPIVDTDQLTRIGGITLYFLGGRDTCCDPVTYTRYKWYPIESSVVLSTVTFCDADWETIGTWERDSSFQFRMDQHDIEETLEDSSDTLFSSTLLDDISSCPNAGSPMWMGAWLDAFTGQGWISPAMNSETHSPGDKHVIGTVEYDLDNLPASTRASGWFGKPFV